MKQRNKEGLFFVFLAIEKLRLEKMTKWTWQLFPCLKCVRKIKTLLSLSTKHFNIFFASAISIYYNIHVYEYITYNTETCVHTWKCEQLSKLRCIVSFYSFHVVVVKALHTNKIAFAVTKARLTLSFFIHFNFFVS